MAPIPATPVTGTPAATAKLYRPRAETKQPMTSSARFFQRESVISYLLLPQLVRVYLWG